MGFIGSMFGGGSGAGFQAQGANQGQADQLYNQNQAFLAQLQAQNGIQNQSNVFNQLQNVASGGGPNPAQAMLNQSTGQNVANQAALMAGQRGANVNPGLIARQAAMQGGNLQQQAVGQGAALQAQQSLGALNQLGGIAGQQVGEQQNALQTQQGNILNSIAGKNSANAGIAAGNQQAQAGLIGGALGGIGSALGLSHGGPVPTGYANTNQGVPQQPGVAHLSSTGSFPGYASGGALQPKSFAANFMTSQNPNFSSGFSAGQGLGQMGAALGNAIGNAFKSKPQMMAGEPAQDPNQMVANQGGRIDYTQGGKLPGKAKVKGDSEKNDIVPIAGSPGEFMVKRTIATLPGAKEALEHLNNSSPDEASKIISEIMAKRKKS